MASSAKSGASASSNCRGNSRSDDGIGRIALASIGAPCGAGGEQDDDDDDDEDEVVGTPCDSNSNLVIFAFVDGASPSSSRSMSAVDSSSALRLDILNPPL